MTAAMRACAVAVVGARGVRVRPKSGATVRVLDAGGVFDPARWCRRLVGERAGRTVRDPGPAVALLAAHAALARAGSEDLPTTHTETGFLVVGTEHGSREVDASYWATAAEHGGAFASPQLFAATLPSAVAGEVALALGLRGPVLAFAGRSPAARRTAAALAADPPPDVAFVLLVEIRGASPARARAVGVTWVRAVDVARRTARAE